MKRQVYTPQADITSAMPCIRPVHPALSLAIGAVAAKLSSPINAPMVQVRGTVDFRIRMDGQVGDADATSPTYLADVDYFLACLPTDQISVIRAGGADGTLQIVKPTVIS